MTGFKTGCWDLKSVLDMTVGHDAFWESRLNSNADVTLVTSKVWSNLPHGLIMLSIGPQE